MLSIYCAECDAEYLHPNYLNHTHVQKKDTSMVSKFFQGIMNSLSRKDKDKPDQLNEKDDSDDDEDEESDEDDKSQEQKKQNDNQNDKDFDQVWKQKLDQLRQSKSSLDQQIQPKVQSPKNNFIQQITSLFEDKSPEKSKKNDDESKKEKNKSIDDINFEIPKRDSLKKVHFLKYNDKDDPFEKQLEILKKSPRKESKEKEELPDLYHNQANNSQVMRILNMDNEQLGQLIEDRQRKGDLKYDKVTKQWLNGNRKEIDLNDNQYSDQYQSNIKTALSLKERFQNEKEKYLSQFQQLELQKNHILIRNSQNHGRNPIYIENQNSYNNTVQSMRPRLAIENPSTFFNSYEELPKIKPLELNPQYFTEYEDMYQNQRRNQASYNEGKLHTLEQFNEPELQSYSSHQNLVDTQRGARYLPVRNGGNGQLFIDAAQNQIFNNPLQFQNQKNIELQYIHQNMKNINDKIDEIYRKVIPTADNRKEIIQNQQIIQSLNNQISSTQQFIENMGRVKQLRNRRDMSPIIQKTLLDLENIKEQFKSLEYQNSQFAQADPNQQDFYDNDSKIVINSEDIFDKTEILHKIQGIGKDTSQDQIDLLIKQMMQKLKEGKITVEVQMKKPNLQKKDLFTIGNEKQQIYNALEKNLTRNKSFNSVKTGNQTNPFQFPPLQKDKQRENSNYQRDYLYGQ